MSELDQETFHKTRNRSMKTLNKRIKKNSKQEQAGPLSTGEVAEEFKMTQTQQRTAATSQRELFRNLA